MNIMRVVRDLVTTHRVSGLHARQLRVLEDAKGNIEVAVDAVGARAGDFVITIAYSSARIATGDPRVTTDLTIGGIIDDWNEDKFTGRIPAAS
ncbi:carboxysome peptide B [Aquicoccus porphyridii]|uniref:carboxysome peptide B n=1 Tax=Aquicoccus porphyridii TaxID=1852029 RepID=UPI00273EF533|nr:carboxysome peptide B [Aquicoccus porphyridii]